MKNCLSHLISGCFRISIYTIVFLFNRETSRAMFPTPVMLHPSLPHWQHYFCRLGHPFQIISKGEETYTLLFNNESLHISIISIYCISNHFKSFQIQYLIMVNSNEHPHLMLVKHIQGGPSRYIRIYYIHKLF